VNRGSKAITFLETTTPIFYSLYNFYGAPTTTRGRLSGTALSLGGFRPKIGPKFGGLGRGGKKAKILKLVS